ncbi:MAG: hypothetical protein ABSG57_12770 [Candidatus Bathyarchaeia archaeon]
MQTDPLSTEDSDTNWQDIPDDQKTELDRTVCDKLVFDDFERFVKTERFKFRVFVASLKPTIRSGSSLLENWPTLV